MLRPSLHARTLLFGVSLVLAGVLAMRGYMELATDGRSSRVQSILRALPQIATDKTPAVLLFGTSTASMGVSPAVFEQVAADAGISVRFYNFGVPGWGPKGDLLLGRRVREAYAAAGRRPALVLMEFDPSMATIAHRHTIETRRRGEPGLCAVTRGSEWHRDLAAAPAATVRTAFCCLVFDQPTSFVGTAGPIQRVFTEAPQWWFGDSTPPVPRQRLENIGERRAGIEFTMTNHGYQDPFEVGSVDDYNALAKTRTPEFLKRRAKTAIPAHDARDLHFDDRYVRDVFTSIKEWQAFGTKVHVIMPPFDPAYLDRSPEGDARRAAMLALIAKTGVRIFETEKFVDDFHGKFFDIYHLNHLTGVPYYTRLIFQDVVGMLR